MVKDVAVFVTTFSRVRVQNLNYLAIIPLPKIVEETDISEGQSLAIKINEDVSPCRTEQQRTS